jgi:hypothetical protein
VVLGVNRRVLFWLAMVVAALGLGVGASAAGSQPEPSIKVQPDEAQPGETVTVIGECWGGCDDQSAVVSPVTLTLLQGETEVPDFEAVEVDLDPPADGSFEQEIDLPPGLDEGKYKLAAESRDGDTATDKLLVGQSTSNDGGGGDDGDDSGDGDDDSDDEDDPDRSSADPEDCTAPPLTPQPPAPAGVDTQAPAADTPTADSDQADDCASATPPPTTPADQAVLGESQTSNGSNGNSGSDSSDGSGNGDEDEGDEDDDRERNKDKRALKNTDGDSDAGDDEDSGAGGAGNGNDRGQDGAAASRAPVETVRAAAGPTPEDIRESVPWAMIALLGALFAIGLGATYHVVGRWAPDPADVG